MALPPGQYILGCWNSTQNPAEINRPKLLFQCYKLIKALQAKLKGQQVIVPSRDEKDSRKGIEICVMYAAGSGSSFANIAETLTKEAELLSLDYKVFVEQQESLTRYFNASELDNISELLTPATETLTEKNFQEMEQLAQSWTGFDVSTKWAKVVEKEKMGQPILVLKKTLARLRKAEKDDLRKEITALMDSLHGASMAKSKTAWQTILMIGAGAIAVAGWVAKAAAIGAWVSNALLMISFVASFLTVGAIAAAVTVLFGVFGLLLGTYNVSLC